MEYNEQSAKDYQKGFNEGYLISKNSPEIAEHLLRVDFKSDRMEGIKGGMAQFEQEKSKEQSKQKKDSRLPSYLKRDRLSNIDRQDKDKDIEPEH